MAFPSPFELIPYFATKKKKKVILEPFIVKGRKRRRRKVSLFPSMKIFLFSFLQLLFSFHLAFVLQNLTNNLGSLAIRLEQLLALLALLLDAVVLVEELLKEGLLVQLADKAVLDDVLAVVDEEVHDGLGDLVGDGLADDVEVG